MDIIFNQVTFHGVGVTVSIADWQLNATQSWGIFTSAGDVGATLAALFCQEITPQAGTIVGLPDHVAQVSLAEQQRLLAEEIANDDTDFLDKIDTGSTVYSLIYSQCHDAQLCTQLLQDLHLEALQESGFRVLSTGETRRLMLARALATKPALLILDDPFAGLDKAHRAHLTAYLEEISKRTRLIIISAREDELPHWINQVALFTGGELLEKMGKAAWDQHPIIAQINAQSAQQSAQLIQLIHKHQHNSQFDNPLFELKDGKVAYTDTLIFSGVDWRINNGEHWQIRGPNGCGKSTLLGLIFGDHPQCYSNDIQIFGKKRGSGETIWDIKQNIGMVSSALHLQYRVNCTALEVVLSGFYDSIGLYKQATKQQIAIAKEWLALLHMSTLSNTSFKQLAYAQQRLLLIARALVKQPALLILDEPYQGLDHLGRRLVMNTLEMIAKENLSQLLYVSHYQEDALQHIHHFVDFIGDDKGEGYQIRISQR